MAEALTASDTGPHRAVPTDQSADHPGRVPAFARPAGFTLWLLVTGVIGAAGSFLLLMERVRLWQDPEHVAACDLNPWIACGEVMQSWQASTFGFPNVFIGVVGFPLVIAVALSLFANGGRMPRWYYGALQAAVTFAMGFIIWLWYATVYSIGVLCPYCMVVWTAVIPLFVVTTARNIMHGVIPASTGLKRIAADWWWVTIVVLYLLVFFSIVMGTPEAFSSGG